MSLVMMMMVIIHLTSIEHLLHAITDLGTWDWNETNKQKIPAPWAQILEKEMEGNDAS